MAERTLGSERIYEGRVIRVRVDTVELSTGRSARREIVEHPGAVAIVAWDGARLALVRQWRHAAGRPLLEIPAGTLDPGEEPLATARRELAEECGLSAGRWLTGPRFFTAPGFCTELMHLFLATDLSAADGSTEDDEEIELEWRTLADARAAVDSGDVADAKTIAGILWFAGRAPLA
ncbi:MAG TPA: NUDIX hydrolase [Candidatus Limnocylindria bacterium]|nr:NUDIX hydrolase [Candidatus Limnocylindria bacterium]